MSAGRTADTMNLGRAESLGPLAAQNSGGELGSTGREKRKWRAVVGQ